MYAFDEARARLRRLASLFQDKLARKAAVAECLGERIDRRSAHPRS
jgi:hypothetical protein